MVNQGLWRPAAPDGESVLRALVGMQAQEFGYALWSVAQRIDDPVGSADLLTAFDDGRLLRTHVLRPTWHFALPEDIRWLLRLTAPKLRSINGYYDRQLGLDRCEIDRSRTSWPTRWPVAGTAPARNWPRPWNRPGSRRTASGSRTW